MTDQIVQFLRQKDLVFQKDLGQGACGRTVLLYDEIIDEYFVCKKYAPIEEDLKTELFLNFVREVKLLHLLNHPNVVRVFNYYLYPANFAGYILMEYVRGLDVEDYLGNHPENANQVFLQAVEGFHHLESNGILHRDIRPQNLLVSDRGHLKIIDFGFGKRVATREDFGKSISLNWWCEPPAEFAHGVYDYATEVYFVGQLFQKVIVEKQIEQFNYAPVVTRMCAAKPDERLASFSDVRTELLAAGFHDIDFGESDLVAYRDFSDCLNGVVSKIEQGAKFVVDPDEIQRSLEDVYKKTMIEQFVPKNSLV